MNDREKWRETVRDIRAGGATWWWWYIYIYIRVCTCSTLGTSTKNRTHYISWLNFKRRFAKASICTWTFFCIVFVFCFVFYVGLIFFSFGFTVIKSIILPYTSNHLRRAIEIFLQNEAFAFCFHIVISASVHFLFQACTRALYAHACVGDFFFFFFFCKPFLHGISGTLSCKAIWLCK